MIVTEKYMVSLEGLANKFIFQQRSQRNQGVSMQEAGRRKELFESLSLPSVVYEPVA